jgi:hypothetical protein
VKTVILLKNEAKQAALFVGRKVFVNKKREIKNSAGMNHSGDFYPEFPPESLLF